MRHRTRTGGRRAFVTFAAAAGFLAAAAIVSCGHGDAPVPAASSAPVAGVVDSALPISELERRFRVGLDSVSTLDSGAAPSRDAVVTRFVRALETRDTARLRSMAITRAEFAYLYYPSTIYVRPPYETGPETLWRLMAARSASGLSRVVARVGGAPIRMLGYDCDATPKIEGANRYHEQCYLRYRRTAADSVERRRLFGSIMERDGRFKFVGYANDF
ncbi:MAG TPA: hypothetical protein VF761_03880 [Gemmatimonadaceae bacterium]